MSQKKLPEIKVEVVSRYDVENSRPINGEYLFEYEVSIFNLGDSFVQLLSRFWFIKDGQGAVEEVRGPGVVGETPVIRPGESFVYTSFCPLKTPTGTMRGAYTMADEKGQTFEVKIPQFQLKETALLH